MTEAVLSRLIDGAAAGEGREPNDRDIDMLLNLRDYLQERFARHLDRRKLG